MANLKITLIKSLIGRLKSHKACANGLGVKKINQSSVVKDTPENRGMIKKIEYMLRVENEK
ncbi:MAG: 50S ribosomal protein L30 [Gammaproteobacteria bacterium]|nr:50S ribosomal protein L30 [Gammaproteobacteria bacterium]|tara:strand:- start:1218 stop:1400 length:183 start_codon:yes stop_codon:yes gene_type:complete